MTGVNEVVELQGKVCSGLGEGSGFTQMDWVLRQFSSKLDLTPYPGTFNLEMEGPDWEQALELLQGAPGIEITPPDGFCSAKCFRVLIRKQLEGVLVLPEVEGYPRNKFEIVAPLAVRETLEVEDGDRVKIELHIQ